MGARRTHPERVQPQRLTTGTADDRHLRPVLQDPISTGRGVMAEVTVKLIKTKVTTGTNKFDEVDEGKGLKVRNIYITNDTLKVLEEPTEIEITIRKLS
jgi:hypothetical protein